MKKAMVSIGLIEQLGELELALLSLTQLAERISRLDETASSSDCDSVATLLRMILNDYQNVVLRLQCEVDESTLRSVPKDGREQEHTLAVFGRSGAKEGE